MRRMINYQKIKSYFFGDRQQDVYLTKEDEEQDFPENFETADEELLFSQSQSDVLMTEFEECRKGYENAIMQVQ